MCPRRKNPAAVRSLNFNPFFNKPSCRLGIAKAPSASTGVSLSNSRRLTLLNLFSPICFVALFSSLASVPSGISWALRPSSFMNRPSQQQSVPLNFATRLHYSVSWDSRQCRKLRQAGFHSDIGPSAGGHVLLAFRLFSGHTSAEQAVLPGTRFQNVGFEVD